LIDPIEDLIVGHDTTFTFMLECHRRGHEVRYFEQSALVWRGNQSVATMHTVEVRREKGNHFTVLGTARAPLSDLDVLFLRKDPPFDGEFLHATLLVELSGAGAAPFIINRPSGLRDANEKLWALRYPELVPPTLISREIAELRAFLEEQDGEMIVKPVDGFAGRGVFHVHRKDRNLGSVLETMTQRGTIAVVAQKYLPESREGDKRVILLDGDPIGAILRVPPEHDARGNMAAGGKAVQTTLSDRDREICAHIAPALREAGLWFVGVDIIGRWLTEVNVTSPTGVEEANALDGVALERQVIPRRRQLMQIDRMVVIGAGQMGRGIAQVAAEAGLTVALRDSSPELAEGGRARLESDLRRLVKMGKRSSEDVETCLGRISVDATGEAIAAADFVIEAASETLEVKEAIFRDSDQRIGEHAILASNTSSISLTKLAAVTSRPEQVIGLHFMNPVPMMKLVEIVRALQTSDDTYRATCALADRLGKTPVTTKDMPAFIVNRLLIPQLNEACFALTEGLGTMEDIDTAARLGLNHPMGPFQLADLIGLDTVLYIGEVLHREFGDDKYRPAALLRNYVAAGWLGRKTGRGFYTYDDAGRIVASPS
jgi:glutathione synthetase